MKNLDKRWLLFLVLILVLATGLPYLSLNQEASTTTDVESEDVQSMSIALVNEDEGARFNGSELTFGEAFVRSLDSNDEHNWFVVSRGVAESGLDRNTYDMMIVIPNDFSEKALSIDSESPEQVVLNYQINASDDEYVKAEAERTASTILNEFNRRIIDVYFASIIGNLQDAQDNVGEIVEKQTQHTTTYNNDINNPLSNYTNQFGMIKDNTQASRDSFSGLEDMMEGFEDRLAEGADQQQGHSSELDEFSSVKEENVNELLSFSDALLQFDNSLKTDDVEEQLVNLQEANSSIGMQLDREYQGDFDSIWRLDDWQRLDGELQRQGDLNVVTDSDSLKAYIHLANQRVRDLESSLEAMDEDIKGNIKDQLKNVFEEAFGDEIIDIGAFFDDPDTQTHNRIQDQIEKLPTLNKRAINQLKKNGLSKQKVIELKNVIRVTNKYLEEYDEEEEIDRPPSHKNILKKDIQAIKEHFAENEVTMTDRVRLPEIQKDEVYFSIESLPKHFQLLGIDLNLPSGEPEPVPGKELTWKLPNNMEEGQLDVSITVKMEGSKSKVKLFQPIPWEWKITTEETEEIEENNSEPEQPNDPDESNGSDEYATVQLSTPLVATMSVEVSDENNEDGQEENLSTNDDVDNVDEEPTNPKEGDSTEPTEDQTENNQGENEESTDSDSDSTEEVTDSENEEPVDSEEEIDPEEAPEEGTGQEPEENEEKVIERVEMTDNYIHRPVMEPVYDEATQMLMNAVTKKVSPFQRLISSYELYFGLDMESWGLKKILKKDSLAGLASRSEESLYYLFNERDFEELSTNYIISNILDGITERIRAPLGNLHEDIEEYKGFAERAENRADELAEKINQTSQQALLLNSSLEETLNNVANWREQSLNLLDQHGVVQENDKEEQQAILTLNNDFQPLLSESQSIAEQAEGNLSSAESVYQTLDTIDGQADTIEQSGANLVTQAEQLSTNMTEKMLENQEFADNFSDVLANSRVGERQNENLYNFLSNPVQTSNEGTQGTIASSDNFTPYFLVLTIFIVVLFTAYVISTLHQKRTEDDQFAQEKSLMATNTPITLITAGIGVLEGIAIGVISSYLLQISEGGMVLWTILITTLITGMLLVATYLLRQLKMIGMFVLLIVMSMYLFLTNAFGAGIAGLEHLRAYSPLQYVESILLQAVQGNANYILAMIVIAGVIVIGALANLFVLTREGKGDMKDEGSTEAS